MTTLLMQSEGPLVKYEQSEEGFTIGVPADWFVLDLDPRYISQSVAAMVDAIAEEMPEMKPYQPFLAELFTQLGNELIQKQAKFAAFHRYWDGEQVVTVSCNLFVIDISDIQPDEKLDKLLADTSRSLDESPQWVTGEHVEHIIQEERNVEIFSRQYSCAHGEKVYILSFGTPNPGAHQAYERVYRDIAESMAFVQN